MSKPKVGFIGLGAMGLPMARRLLGAGYKMYATFHRRREPAEQLQAMGADILSNASEVAKAADVIITILPADAELKETVLGPAGIIRAGVSGKTLIEMTSGTPLAMQEVDAAFRSAGGKTLDAPVSGGTPAAAQGTLTIMVGGETSTLEECRPLLETMGKNIVHVGPVGQGKMVKIVNQMMAAVHLLMIGEAFALGVRGGGDPTTLYDVIKTSSGYSKMMDLRLPGFLLENSFEPGFRLDLMTKDVNLAVESAKTLGVPLFLTSIAAQVFSAASAAGRGDRDFSAAGHFLAALSGAELSKRKRKTA